MRSNGSDSCRILCEYAKQLSYKDLPDNVIEHTKMFIADYYAASIAGYRINTEFNRIVLDIIKEEGGSRQASILLDKRKYPSSQAAFINALYAHGADMDDGNKKSAGHIGAHVISSVFALAEYEKSRWRDIIPAIIVGYDFFNRIAGASQPSLYNKGFHSTGVAGSLACAAACAKLLRLDVDGIYNSVSIAAVQSSGLIIIDESAQHCKPINAANAARTGVLSALMAVKGLEAPINPLESPKGWFNAYAGEVDRHVLLDNLGKVFTIEESYLKLYPSCRHTHACIDAARSIREEFVCLGYTCCDIAEVHVEVYPNAIRSAGRISHPKMSGEAKFSIHYAVAKALLNGNFTLNDLKIETNEDVDQIINRTVITVNESLENRMSGIRGARVRVVFKDGTIKEDTVPVPKGEGDNSLDWKDLEDKMISCSSSILSIEEAKDIIRQCREIDVDKTYEHIKIKQI